MARRMRSSGSMASSPSDHLGVAARINALAGRDEEGRLDGRRAAVPCWDGAAVGTCAIFTLGDSRRQSLEREKLKCAPILKHDTVTSNLRSNDTIGYCIRSSKGRLESCIV
jgi:hypothetical protein